MADFDLRISERQFTNLGVRVEFDENLYGELLDQTSPDVPGQVPAILDVIKIPIVNIVPAPVWGASKAYELAALGAHNDKEFPGGSYDWRTATIDIRASEKPEETNKSLLYESRVWSADISGDYAEAFQVIHDRRGFRRATLLGGVGTGAAIGFGVGSLSSAVIGGIVGLVPGLVPGAVDNLNNPYFKEWRQFAKDPEVIAKFGQIITYSSLR